MQSIPSVWILPFVLALPCSPTAHAQWATALGGTETRSGRVETHGPTTPVPGWDLALPNQMALQPVVADGLVVVGRLPQFMDATSSEIVALDLATGAVRWTQTLPLGPGLGLACRPLAIHGGRVYVTRAGYPLVDESLYALDPVDGSVLWESEDLINIGFDSPVFAPNGDLLINGEFVGGFLGYKLLRIDATDGTTVWWNHNGTAGDRAGGVREDDRWYRNFFESDAHRVCRFDMATGQLMYTGPVSPLHPNDGLQADLMLGPEGTIYWPIFAADQSAARIVALEDTGTALVQRWELPTLPLVWSSMGITSDGDALLYSEDHEVLRVDPATGAILDRSAPLGLEFTVARMSVDAYDHVFVTAHEAGPGAHAVIALDANLDLMWSEALPFAGPTAGATLAQDGTLIAAVASSALAPGLTLRTWRGEGCSSSPYCVTTPNSTGQTAEILAEGSFSVAANQFTLVARDLPVQQPGLFFYGQTQTLVPFGNGFRCVANPLHRYAPVASDAAGVATDTPDLTLPPSMAGKIDGGETWSFQFWYRDPMAGPGAFNLTQGVAVTFCP